jgi:hypothetical protein
MNLLSSVEESESVESFTIIPNIVTERATITCPVKPDDEIRIAVYSAGGEMIDILPVSPLISLEVIEVPFNLTEYSHLANGQYFLELTINGHPTESLPFIIQR